MRRFLSVGSNFGFQLDINGVGETAFEVGVRIGCAEVSGVEVNAEPRVLDIGDEFKQVFGGSDGVMVFDAEEDAFGPGVVGAFLESLGYEFVGLFAWEGFVVASKHANVRGAEDGCTIDPQFAFRDFFVPFLPFLEGEVVSDGGATDGDALEKRVFSDVGEIGIIDGSREEVAGEFGTGAVVFCAVVDEAEHVEGRFGRGLIGSVCEGSGKVVSE